MTEVTEPSRLQSVLDEWDCRQLQQQYWWAETLCDSEMFVNVFTEDAKVGSVQGREAIRAMAQSFMGPGSILATLLNRYFPAPVIVDFKVDGDAASGKVYGMSFHRFLSPEGNEKMRIVASGYRNQYRRTSEGWRISSMCAIDQGDNQVHDTYWRFEGDIAMGALA